MLWIKRGNAADDGGEGELVTGGFTNENLRFNFLDKKRKLLFRELSLTVF